MYFPNSISEVIPPQTVAAIMDTIERSEQIVITTHSSPDGDALGSTLALYHFLKRSKKQGAPHRPQLISLFLKMD